MSNITLHIPRESILEDNRDWRNRFEIRSESSDRVYIVAQHKGKKHWACSCMGYKRYRKCKHLAALSLPAYEQPFTGNIEPR